MASLDASDIRRMTDECERAGGLNLGQGICDLPAPPAVTHAAMQAIERHANTYASARGVEGLRRAIAEKLLRDNHLSADPVDEIVVTCGATGGYACTLQALLNPGDGVAFLEPFYGYSSLSLRRWGLPRSA
jgi:aminotransferase